MKITAFDLESSEMCSIEILIRRLTASADPREAIYWGKILALIEHMLSSGPEPHLRGQVLLDNVFLSVLKPPDPVRAKAIKEFTEEWTRLNPDAAKRPRDLVRALRKQFPEDKTSVIVRVDWLDYAPLRGKIPDMHYRIQIKYPGKILTEDVRAKTPQEAERAICSALG